MRRIYIEWSWYTLVELLHAHIAQITATGIRIGSPMAMLISGHMSSSPEYGGWPASFYLFGSLSLLWSICWLFITRNSPQLHPKISQQELVYLKETIDASHDHASVSANITIVMFLATPQHPSVYLKLAHLFRELVSYQMAVLRWVAT